MYLPEGIILLIFARLPVKSLVRFKQVCKSWYSLIKSPILIDEHLSISHDRAPQQIIMKFYGEPENKTILSFHSINEFLKVTAPDLEVSGLGSELSNHVCVQFIGSCNGILCITNSMIIILCNPALREFRTLPSSPFGCTYMFRGELVCESVDFGFGFDQISNDYKVVSILSFGPKERDQPRSASNSYCRAGVYNLKTDSWREAKAILPQYSLFSPPGILVKGCFHWLAELWGRIGDWFILSFHLSTEEFCTIRRPPIDFNGCRYRTTLAALHESLACIAWTEYGIIEVWIMNESWTRQYIIKPPIRICLGYLLYVQMDNMLLMESNDGQLVSFCFPTYQSQSLQIWPYGIHVYPVPLDESLRHAIYKESLVSITRD